MKRSQSILFMMGAVLALVGAATFITGWEFSPWVYTVGASMVAIVQLSAHYSGKDLVMKRLRRQQIFGALFLVLTSVFMFTNRRGNEWIICLTIASVLELYTAFRMPQVEEKNKSV